MNYMLVVLMALGTFTATGSDIYVSTEGNDDWSGKLPAPAENDGPLRTIKKAAEVISPGQTCFIRGGTYRETLRPSRSGETGRPIIFKSFKDEEVVVSAADLLSGWTRDDGGILKAPMDWDLKDQNQIFADGTMLQEARWPKGGTLLQPVRALAASGTDNSLTDPNIPGDRDAWKGATLWCAGGDRWVCWSEEVTGYDPGKHTLSFKMKKPEHWYTVRKDSPYVLMGVRSALQAPGECWYDSEKKQILLIPPKGFELSSSTVEAKRRLHCVDLSGRSNVEIIGLRFRGGGVMTDSGTENARLLRCKGEYVAHSYVNDVADSAGIIIDGSSNTVESCEFAYSSTSVLRVKGCDHCIVNNYLHDGNYGGKWTGAVALSGRRILFSHNTVRHSGRDLLSVHELMESLVQYNDLSEAGWLTCDLGMTYGHSTDFMNTVFRFNRVHDNHAKGCSMGIYFDHCSHNVIVCNNLIYNTGDSPIRINNPSYFGVLYNNSCWRTGVVSTFDHSNREDLFGMRLANNIFNRNPKLPGHVVLENNIVSEGSCYVDPAGGDFTLKPDSPACRKGLSINGVTGGSAKPDIGAFQSGNTPWKAGCDLENPPDPKFERPIIDWMNMIKNACFELPTLEYWKIVSGEALLTPGNNWGNSWGSKARGTEEATGTSRQELRLGKDPARIEQKISGLNADTSHTLSGWLKLSDQKTSARLGVRLSDGKELWTEPVSSTSWKRISLDFSTGPGISEITVIIDKPSGDGFVFCDNLGLPRAVNQR